MRFAGDMLKDKPIVPGFNSEDLVGVVPRVDEYGRRIDPNKPPIPEIPRNRGNEQKPGIDVWTAPVRRA